MARVFRTISEQTPYDITIQKFGGLDDMDQVLRQVPDLNTSIPFATELTLADTLDKLARQFDFEGIKFATGDQIIELVSEGDCIPVIIPASIGGCGPRPAKITYKIPAPIGGSEWLGAYSNDYSNDYD